MTSRYAIQSTVETDDITEEPLYWSNRDGWVDRDSATTWGHRDFIRIMLESAIPLGGKWVVAHWLRKGGA